MGASAGGAWLRQWTRLKRKDSMKPSRSGAAVLRIALAACAMTILSTTARGQQEDLLAGAKLYVAQCKMCHGSVSALDQEQAAPALPNWQLARLAMRHAMPDSRSDAAPPVTVDSGMAPGPDRLAFAPPFGPPLRGVYMRPAGTIENFQYSATFMKALKGMEWNDAALDVWITDPQAWVPGVYMFYKQRNADVRRKIIEYLKSAR
jgi:cytochrome c2